MENLTGDLTKNHMKLFFGKFKREENPKVENVRGLTLFTIQKFVALGSFTCN